ncbi:type II secretion system F family protein [Halomarina rubra]|uniref:Type II secretion system F family protein n=1 Tax=Halomarina rubra TaxID=2071873 RepID=A0ABD6AT12_9EURY|nr:type II secretion system F family protein [Halomarina rubra]
MSVERSDLIGGSGEYQERGDTLADLFHPIYRRVFDEDDDFVGDMEKTLAEARIPETVDHYLSRGIGAGALVGAFLGLVITLLGFAYIELYVQGTPKLTSISILPAGPLLTLFDAIKIPLLVVIVGVLSGVVGLFVGFGVFVVRPRLTAGARRREINILLADAVSFMYALSIGGMNQLEILRAMAEADDTYGEVSREFQSVMLETEYFGTDYRSAIRNQSIRTPSKELSEFLTDMLSIIDSGGDMTEFLNDKKDHHLRTAKEEQLETLETIDLFGEMYITLSLFPLLLIIILVVMQMIGEAPISLLYLTVYGIIPIIGVAFIVLVSTVKEDEVGSGYLRPEDETGDWRAKSGVASISDLGLVERYVGTAAIFDRIESREGTFETARLLEKPHVFFREHPLAVLAVTVPVTLVLLVLAVVRGAAPTSAAELSDAPVLGTVIWVYMPLYVNLLPLAVFYEWSLLSRERITRKFSETLRKLSSANNTGLTLLESVRLVADTSTGRLADEFETMHAKANYGVSLHSALVEFNNRYHIPRIARTVNVIRKAQEASSHISEVLTTAARASENQDAIEREQRTQARMQVTIIVMTFLVLLAVMAILKVRFVDVIADLTASQTASGGTAATTQLTGNIDTDLLALLLFHAVTLYAVISGFLAGYIRNGDLLTGAKYAVSLPTVSLLVFAII